MAIAVDGDERLPTLFLSIERPGVEIVATRRSPTTIRTAPTWHFRRVEVRDDASPRGSVPATSSSAWFTEERLASPRTARRDVAADRRLATAGRSRREQGGSESWTTGRLVPARGLRHPTRPAGRLLTDAGRAAVDAEAPE